MTTKHAAAPHFRSTPLFDKVSDFARLETRIGQRVGYLDQTSSFERGDSDD